MKIDMTVAILNEDDEQFSPPENVRRICRKALLTGLPGDENLSFDAKLDLADLADRCKENFPEFKNEEKGKIKDRLAKMMPPLIVGQVAKVFNRHAEDPKSPIKPAKSSKE